MSEAFRSRESPEYLLKEEDVIVGDRVTNRERIKILSSEYDGGCLIPCSSLVGNFAFLDSSTEKSVIKEEVKLFLTTGFLFDVDIGKFVPLHTSPQFEANENGYLTDTSDGNEYAVEYPKDFPNKGMAYLRLVNDPSVVLTHRSVVADASFISTLILSRPYIAAESLSMTLLAIHHRVVVLDGSIRKVFDRDYFDEEDKYFYSRLTGQRDTKAVFDSIVYVSRNNRFAVMPLKAIK